MTALARAAPRRGDGMTTVHNNKSEHEKRRATARTVAQRRNRLHGYNGQSRSRAQ
jgi:hypothetical protein